MKALKREPCYRDYSGAIVHRGGCRPGRPQCRTARAPHVCYCGAYHYPHRAKSGRCGNTEAMDLFVYGPIPDTEPTLGDAFEPAGEVDTSFAFGALSEVPSAHREARAKKVARPRLSPAEARAARAKKTREANARLRRILPKNSPLYVVFFPSKRKVAA